MIGMPPTKGRDNHQFGKDTHAFKQESAWNRINWPRIGRADEYYRTLYQYVEVPWVVNRVFIAATAPPGSSICSTNTGDLVGSAEQGFLALSAGGKIRNDVHYYSVSPCFRGAPPDDPYHNLHFMKVELYYPTGTPKDVGRMVEAAAKFFALEGAIPEIVKTPEGFDLNVGGVEVGSYGYRSVGDHAWVYGTGLAEPRFSQALRSQRDHISLVTAPSVPRLSKARVYKCGSNNGTRPWCTLPVNHEGGHDYDEI